jgi:hypothetical protein
VGPFARGVSFFPTALSPFTKMKVSDKKKQYRKELAYELVLVTVSPPFLLFFTYYFFEKREKDEGRVRTLKRR